MSFLAISNEIFFTETQSPRLGAIVVPNKGLELTLLGKIGTKKVSRIIWPWVNVKEKGNKNKLQTVETDRTYSITRDF